MPSLADTLELKSEKANAHDGRVFSVDFDKEGGKIVSGGEDGMLKVWKSGAPKPQNHLSRPETDLPCLPWQTRWSW